MDLDLTAAELRILGCLVEKERTTPDNYPLSTNALTSACNQKTSRDPVMSLSETDVDAAVLSLRQKGLARSLKPNGSRAWKHRHVITEVIPLDDAELTVMAVLILRGPQTSGELRTRTERMHSFDSVEAVESTLASLAARDEPLVRNVGRGPGQSQDRWVDTLSAERPVGSPAAAAPAAVLGARPQPTVESPRPDRTDEFRSMHASGLFIMPNPWDGGSARILERRGFRALATTSAGFGRSIGKDDQEVTRDELVRHVADLTEIVSVPLNVDSERLYPDEPGGIRETVRLLASAGAAGCSIEDYDPARRSIDETDHSTAAVAEAAAACAEHGLVLTARAENHLYGIDDLDDTIARLQSYTTAGAEVLYAPGLRTALDIELVLSEISLPLNVLARPDGPTIAELEQLGVRRVSTGGALYNAAYRVLATAADELLTEGTSGYARS